MPHRESDTGRSKADMLVFDLYLYLLKLVHDNLHQMKSMHE